MNNPNPVQVLASIVSDPKFRLAFDISVIADAVGALRGISEDLKELESLRPPEDSK
jgi:hypothetical protein